MMKITTYRELDAKEEASTILSLSFGGSPDPRYIGTIIKLDPRIQDGPVGFCALENGHIVGFVGTIAIPTRNVDGDTEIVGGIWGVSTHPRNARQGVSTALMNEAHRYFRERGYRFSFLMTNRTIIAYAFYRSLAYEEELQFPSAIKFLSKSRKTKVKGDTRIKWKKVADVYKDFMTSRTGFAVRNTELFKALPRMRALDRGRPENVVVKDEGYVFYGLSGGTLTIDEIVPTGGTAARDLVNLIEGKAKNVLHDRVVLNRELFEIYRSRGYITQNESYGLLMVKPLTSNATFSQTYGTRFYATGFDLF